MRLLAFPTSVWVTPQALPAPVGISHIRVGHKGYQLAGVANLG
jgi:hypothetical protein